MGNAAGLYFVVPTTSWKTMSLTPSTLFSKVLGLPFPSAQPPSSTKHKHKLHQRQRTMCREIKCHVRKKTPSQKEENNEQPQSNKMVSQKILPPTAAGPKNGGQLTSNIEQRNRSETEKDYSWPWSFSMNVSSTSFTAPWTRATAEND